MTLLLEYFHSERGPKTIEACSLQFGEKRSEGIGSWGKREGENVVWRKRERGDRVLGEKRGRECGLKKEGARG